MNAVLPDPRVIVGGSPRSGTTLLRNMLTSHPDLAVPNEGRFIGTVYRLLLDEHRTNDLPRAWRLIREHPDFRHWRLDRDALAPIVRGNEIRTYPDLIRALLSAYAAGQGKAYSGDKTPANVLRFPLYSGMFPGAGFVHLVRDPREVCMSLALQRWQVGGLTRAARLWRHWVVAARAASVALGERFVEVRYERLVANPEVELGRVCEVAGLAFDDRMLDYTGERTLAAGGHFERSKERLNRNPRPWRDEMTADDVALVELIVGDLMDEMGYERASGRPTLRARRRLVVEESDRIARSQLRKRWFREPPPLPTTYVAGTDEVRPLTLADLS